MTTLDPTSTDGPPAQLLRRLVQPEGQELLAQIGDYQEQDVLALSGRLRATGADPQLLAAALTQARLRAQARPRLGQQADQLMLTGDGLEQATRPSVAARHAERFVQAGVRHVWDLGAGLGLDALAFARAGLSVTAVERDEEVAVAAAANLAAHPGASVQHGDALAVAPGPEDGAWLDPARRTPGVADALGRTRRVFRLSELSPSWEHVQQMAAQAAATGAKLSPGFSAAALPPGTEAEWVSVDGSVVECVIWWGRAVCRPGRSAVVGRGGEEPGWTVVRPVDDSCLPGPLTDASDLGPWLAEPDRAVLAADLTSTLAAEVSGHELDPGVGYVSAPVRVGLPWARWYAVQEVLPLQAKAVRAWCRSHAVGRVTLKKRGVQVDPDAFRAQLRLGPGQGAAATLVLTRVAGRASAVVVTPAGDEAGSAG